jgi:cell division protein FtsW
VRPRVDRSTAAPRTKKKSSSSSGRSRPTTQALRQAAPACYHLVWVTALMLLTLGICMLLSISMASGVRAQAGGESQGIYYYVSRQGIVAVAGLALMFAVTRMDYRRLRKLSLVFMGFVALSLLAVHIPGVGHRVNGASSYIPVGPLSYQPSEFAKLAVVLAGAHFMSTPRVKDGSMRSYLLPFGGMGLVLCGLVVWENDFGTAIIITGLVLGMLWLAGMKTREWLLLTGGGALVGGALMFLLAGGKLMARVNAMFDPSADPNATGYQLTQSLLALGRGGWFGVGPGRSVQKFDYLPEAHNDMIYAILGEEFGFMGAAAVIMLFAVFAVACWRLARRCSDPLGKYLIAGCGMIIILQAAINIGGVVGAIPLTGVPLPFVSYGCNSLVVMLVAVGLVLAVSRRATAVVAPSPAKRYENVTRIDSRRWNGGARSARSGAR